MSAPRAAAGEACAVADDADCAATAGGRVAPAGAAALVARQQIADVPPGDRGGAERGERLRQLAERAGDEEEAAQAGGERARAQRRLAESRRQRSARAPISQPRGTTTVSAATAPIERAASRRIDGRARASSSRCHSSRGCCATSVRCPTIRSTRSWVSASRSVDQARERPLHAHARARRRAGPRRRRRRARRPAPRRARGRRGR